MRHRIFVTIQILIVLVMLVASLAVPRMAWAADTVVHAVLFFSPTCGHCEYVITEVLPPLTQKYGDQLQLVGIDVTNTEGQALYQAALEYYDIPDDRIGVPTLIVGDTVLVGSKEIPEQFPGLVDTILASDGVGWPAIPGLTEALTSMGIQLEEEQAASTGFAPLDKFMQDPAANTIAVIVLLGMLASLVIIGVWYVQGREIRSWPGWVTPVLSVIGLGVAGYMSFIEVTQTEAICGPLGDCNTVQQSPYAFLFGVLPIGIFGLLGYLAILIAWLVKQQGPDSIRKTATLGLWGLAVFGTLFSTYLTFLEPFVIGATCAWCIANAVLITFIMWATSGQALIYLSEASEDESDDEYPEDKSLPVHGS